MLTHERWEDSYVIMSHTCRKIKKSSWQNSQKLVIHCMNHNLPKLCPQLFPIVKAKVCLYDQKQNKNSHPFVTCYILLEVLIRAIKQEKVTKMSSTTTKKNQQIIQQPSTNGSGETSPPHLEELKCSLSSIIYESAQLSLVIKASFLYNRWR